MAPRHIVQVRYVDAHDLHVSWRWLTTSGFGTAYGEHHTINETLTQLDHALPTAPDTISGTLTNSALTKPSTETQLSQQLGNQLWPPALTDQLKQATTTRRPLVRIQPSPRTGHVPWENLTIDTNTRLIELADIVTTTPTALQQRQPPQPPKNQDTILILDPAIPGQRASSALGSVLGPIHDDPIMLALAAAHRGRSWPAVEDDINLFSSSNIDRNALSTALQRRPARMLYVGHVGAAPIEQGQSEDARLHLSCGPDTIGYAPVTRRHRPFTAKDLLLGTSGLQADGKPGAQLWPSPPRVGLIGCESGAEMRFTESFGLASAFLHNGAELVTVSRWVLPTSHAYHRFSGLADNIRPLSQLVTAVDGAHTSNDVIGHLCDWQRQQLKNWQQTGEIQYSPLLWAAMTTLTR